MGAVRQGNSAPSSPTYQVEEVFGVITGVRVEVHDGVYSMRVGTYREPNQPNAITRTAGSRAAIRQELRRILADVSTGTRVERVRLDVGE